MELVPVKYEKHIFVCVNERPEGEDCCMAKGSDKVLKVLREHVNKNGLFHKYNISKSKCLGHCAFGPTIAIYPDGLIFRKVTEEDARKITSEILK